MNIAFPRRAGAVTLSALLVGGMYTVTPAPVAAASTTNVTIRSTPKTPTTGGNVKISGKISTKMKRKVKLQVRKSGKWRTVKTAKTSKKGAYSFTVKMSSTKKFRVAAPKVTVKLKTYNTIKSKTLTVKVAKNRKSIPLYVDPDMLAASYVSSTPKLKAITSQPQARWFSSWTGLHNIQAEVNDYTKAAKKAGRLPVMVLYMIPGRDCGSHSAGGASSAAEYKQWIRAAAAGIEPGSKPIVIVEPDAVAQLGCTDSDTRLSLLRYAMKKMSAAGAWAYLDAGHSNWPWESTTSKMADRLIKAGVKYGRGISLNVSNFNSTSREKKFGDKLVAALSKKGVKGKHYLVDSSRNGSGTYKSGEWCNPSWSGLGKNPYLVKTGNGAFDGAIWIKRPGETDGSCNGGPSSGFWVDGALKLIKNRK